MVMSTSDLQLTQQFWTGAGRPSDPIVAHAASLAACRHQSSQLPLFVRIFLLQRFLFTLAPDSAF